MLYRKSPGPGLFSYVLDRLVAVPLQPCTSLMFLGEGPALALLPVPSGDDLPAGRQDDPADLPALLHGVVINDLSRLVLVLHICSSLPVKPIGQL